MKQYVVQCSCIFGTVQQIGIREFKNKIDFPDHSIFMGVENEKNGISILKNKFDIINANDKNEGLKKVNKRIDDITLQYTEMFETRFKNLEDKHIVGITNDIGGKIDFLIEENGILSKISIKTTFEIKKEEITYPLIYTGIVYQKIDEYIQNKIKNIKNEYKLDFVCNYRDECNYIDDYKVFYISLPENAKEELCEIKFYDGILKRDMSSSFNQLFGFSNSKVPFKFEYNIDPNEKYLYLFNFNINSLELAIKRSKCKVLSIFYEKGYLDNLTLVSIDKYGNFDVSRMNPDIPFIKKFVEDNKFIELRLNDDFFYIEKEYFLSNVNIYESSIKLIPFNQDFEKTEEVYFSCSINKIFEMQIKKQLTEEDYNLWKLKQEMKGVDSND